MSRTYGNHCYENFIHYLGEGELPLEHVRPVAVYIQLEGGGVPLLRAQVLLTPTPKHQAFRCPPAEYSAEQPN
jgi:hypothetical protein